jgi:hypothetical protein
MNQDRFRFFRVVHHESDLLIGVSPGSYQAGMQKTAMEEMNRLHLLLHTYSRKDPRFFSSLDPLPLPEEPDTPEEILTMHRCGIESGTGPMASVAGLLAEVVGRRLGHQYPCEELVVENGGDLFLRCSSDLISVIHAGQSSLSDKMAFVVSPGEWGICTSSGTLGHSYSRGKAEALTIISSSAPLADAWATALANRVQGPEDIEPLLGRAETISAIDGCAVIVGDRIGVRGIFEVKLLSSE